MRIALLAAFAVVLSNQAFAAEKDVETYRYDTQLDVARVLNIAVPNSLYCEVVTAVMTYENGQGQVRKLAYQTLPNSCPNQN